MNGLSNNSFLSVGKKLNKKDLLSTNLATKKGYCTQRRCGMKRADVERFNFSNSLTGMFYDRLLGVVFERWI